MIEIKHRSTGKVLLTVDADTLAKADLSCADLSYADLSCADLSYADLSCADLSYADLSLANLVYADLSGANLNVANLYRATLIRANLSNANLCRADSTAANLTGADFSGANLAGASFAYKYVCDGGYVAYPEIGSRRDTLHAFSTNRGPLVRTGCFTGTLDEFAAAVRKTHANNAGHRSDYRRVIAEIRETLK